MEFMVHVTLQILLFVIFIKLVLLDLNRDNITEGHVEEAFKFAFEISDSMGRYTEEEIDQEWLNYKRDNLKCATK